MKDIIKIHNDKPRAGTFLIAEGFGREHGKLLLLINKYRSRFENFSPLPAERIKTKGRPVEQLLLDEDQTMFLGTLLRNTEIVLDFKETLVHQFKKARLLLQTLSQHKADPNYQITRDAGKLVRKSTTDEMQAFVEYAENQGSQNAVRYYTNITRMMNGMLFIVEGKYKNLREVMSIPQLMTTASAEQIINKGLHDGMKAKRYYKDIYKDVRKNVELFAELHGQSEVISTQLSLGEDK